MKIEGSYSFTAPRDLVWSMLLDPEVLASILPGCEKLEKVGDNDYQGILKIRVGPVQGKFNGVVTLTDIKAPESYQLTVNGKGAPGFVNGSGNLQLNAENGSTVMQYQGDAQVGGRIASVGQRLLDTSARAIIRQSLEGLDQQIQSRLHSGESAAEESTPTPATAPSQTEFAAGVLKNMWDDMLPPERRDELMPKLLLLFAAILILNLVDQWRMNRLARKIARRLAD